jgi:hypothetical protein
MIIIIMRNGSGDIFHVLFSPCLSSAEQLPRQWGINHWNSSSQIKAG